MRNIVNLTAAILFAGATVVSSAPAQSADDVRRRAGSITIFGWPVAGPKRVFAPDRAPRTTVPAPTNKTPLGAAECRGSGGKIETVSECASGKLCRRQDENGNVRQACLSQS